MFLTITAGVQLKSYTEEMSLNIAGFLPLLSQSHLPEGVFLFWTDPKNQMFPVSGFKGLEHANRVMLQQRWL